MKNYFYIAVSLDGFIARSDGDIDWLMKLPNPEKSDYGFGEFIKKIDAIVMGKNTFEKVVSFEDWPYIKPVFVLSSKLRTIPPGFEDKTEFINGDPSHIVKYLNARGFDNLYIDGGITIRKFIQADLVNEMIISVIPIILGSGMPLFGNINVEQKYEHVKTDIFKNGIVKNHYRRVI